MMDLQNALQMALKHYRDGHLDRVDKVCRKILKAWPDQPDALHLSGVAALGAGKPERAIERIENAIAKSPDNPSYHVSLGDCHRALGHLDEAVTCYERGVAMNPQWAQGHSSLGAVLQAQGKMEDALDQYDRALGIDPTFAQAHFNRGDLLAQRGELEDAAASYERGVRVLPNFADGYAQLGDVLQRLERFAPAGDAYRRAVEIDPSRAAEHRKLSTVTRHLGRYDEALAHVDRALKIANHVVDAHMERGQVLLASGRVEEAIAAFRAATMIDPDSSWAYRGLAAALCKAGRLTDAQAATSTALSLRRTRVRPCLGPDPVGRVVILRGAEGECFQMYGHGDLKLRSETNNAGDHFDRRKFSMCDFFVDGLELGRAMDEFPDCDVIYNALADSEAAPRSHKLAAEIAGAAPVPVINHPKALESVRRHKISELFDGIEGLVLPKTINLPRAGISRSIMESRLREAEITLPVVARCAGTHTGESLEKVESLEALWDYLSRQSADSFYVGQFFDFAASSGFYTKMRFFVVDGELFPTHLYVWNDWCVNQATQVKGLMAEHDWMMEDAERFLAEPETYLGEPRTQTLAAACARVPLDYFGIDFACLPGNKLLIFEANPAMRLPPPENDPLPFRVPYNLVIRDALQRLLEKKIRDSKRQRDRDGTPS